ncbi:MAG: ABC transporter substrate-binding protein [Acidobacteriota bacterium]|nr:ABC transporter substrate-binding protein [Acidobacteriota bacterium]
MLGRPTRRILWVAVVSTAVLASCRGNDEAARETGSPGAVSTPVSGGIAVLGSISDVDSWNEYLSREAFANSILRRIYLRLAREDGEDPSTEPGFEPELAESWEIAHDGLSITFRLRDTSWSDGQPVTSNDVRFTWLAQTHPDVAWAGASSKEFITDVEVVDPRTVIFHFDRVYPYQMIDAIDGGILPEHVFGKVPFDAWHSHPWSEAKIASGPFLLEQHRPNEEIVLVRNPRYYGVDDIHLDGFVVRIVPDAINLLTQLRSGNIDYMENIQPRDAEAVDEDGDTSLLPFDSPGYHYIGWNGAREPFDDPEIRRALTMAIDRQAIVEELLYGFGRVSAGPWPSHRWGADPGLEPLPYDPGAAKRILADRGYRLRNGVLEKDGHPFSFTMTTNAGNRVREEVLVKVQAQLARLGIEVELEPLEMGAFRKKVGSGDYDSYVGGWVFAGKTELKVLFDSQAVPPNGLNMVAYRSGDVDRLLGHIGNAETHAQLQPVLFEIQRQIHRDQPYTFLFESKRLAGVGRRLEGVGIDAPADPLRFLERAWMHVKTAAR